MSTGLVGLVLAGGRSSRFGTEKAAALLDGRPLLLHAHAALAVAAEAVAVSARPGSEAERLAQGLGLTVLHDTPGHPSGPLAGIVAGLVWARKLGADRLALAPCDTPRMSGAMLQRIDQALRPGDVVAAAMADDTLHALCAVLRVSAADELIRMLDRGEHPPIRALWADLGLRPAPFEGAEAEAFANVNRPEDLARLSRP
jgi:molybdopterin-guanine dinucleotide biosynthesis protein A